MKGMLRMPMTDVTGLGRFERGTSVLGDGAVIMVHGGAAGMIMIVMVMMVFVLVLVIVVVSVPRQLVSMHVEMVTAHMRVEDEPGAWNGDTRDEEQHNRGRETAGANAPPLHDRWPLPHPGTNGHVVHARSSASGHPMPRGDSGLSRQARLSTRRTAGSYTPPHSGGG